ncbi:arsenite efflux membrane protein ArsB [Halorhodospira halophila SL1]|uniref:Arsenical pump membrane protein n=1 Tax=Halorhodospira halophila (strain DSM 244 / SL1) TaxID=349124 RepID=A1WTU1_HALHL|nr:arsenic transporter [Halorhodospira halophila]ABM61103.1 arsenite efflux membrane protein ArsB [Halorhodospira halophila SL1]MBK1729820.1 arsenical efflux pump membrane protein ArsB [Halorhodospira halophila]
MLLAAIAIFVVTIALVIWQPKGLGIGWSATAGALVALATGVVELSDVPIVVDIVWNATLTFVFIIIISLLLDEAGFFEWAALHVARWGRGSGLRLYAFIILLGAAVAAIFANDGAALMLTPIVLEMLLALGFTAGAAFAFVIAAGFIADTASLPLVISNLVNIVSADFFGIGFKEYATVMVPVTVVSVVASLAVLTLFFRKQIPRVYETHGLRDPQEAIKDPAVFKAGWGVLGLLLFAFLVIEPMGVPISAIVGVGAAILLAVAARGHAIATRTVLKNAPWQIVIFSVGMYLVVYGLRNEGLTGEVAGLLDVIAEQGVWVATVGTGFIAAFLASVMNNMPGVMVVALSIDESAATGLVKEAMIYANVVGSDLGPKITPIGSLATLLWLHVLARKGVHITWAKYFAIGIVITPPVLLVTLLALAGWLTVLH